MISRRTYKYIGVELKKSHFKENMNKKKALEAANEYILTFGLKPIPCNASKAPCIGNSWTQITPTVEKWSGWVDNDKFEYIGIITGKTENQTYLVCLDFDVKDFSQEFASDWINHFLDRCSGKLVNAPREITKSGGVHIWIYIDNPTDVTTVGNRKLIGLRNYKHSSPTKEDTVGKYGFSVIGTVTVGASDISLSIKIVDAVGDTTTKPMVMTGKALITLVGAVL